MWKPWENESETQRIRRQKERYRDDKRWQIIDERKTTQWAGCIQDTGKTDDLWSLCVSGNAAADWQTGLCHDFSGTVLSFKS